MNQYAKLMYSIGLSVIESRIYYYIINILHNKFIISDLISIKLHFMSFYGIIELIMKIFIHCICNSTAHVI